MRNPTQSKQPKSVLFIAVLCGLLAAFSTTFGQTTNAPMVPMVLGTDNTPVELVDYVSIQVDGGTIRQVLNAFAIQTKRNVVIGPEVISEDVNIHLTRVRWNEALEVILKPYGFGYRIVGDTIVISQLDKLAALAAVEPLETRVFELRFLDAADVQEMLSGQLSGRGRMSIMLSRGQKGWAFAGGARGSSRGTTSLSKRGRVEGADELSQSKSKTIVVTDIPGVLDSIEGVLSRVDKMPSQVLVEARFVEVSDNFLRDIGVELGGSFDIGGNPVAASEKFFDVTPNAFVPKSTEIAGKRPLNTFGQLSFTSSSAEILLNLLEETDDSKTLSAPSILTLNNQEATIIVGQKFPIIESDVSGDQSSTVSTTLDYYENIGIQLNVVPQISSDGFINMIVHPSVSSIQSYETGIVSSSATPGEDTVGSALTRYPVIATREAETQILLKSSDTVVIGGLLEERESTTVFKVPFLGDIPLLKWLFRREVTGTKTIDLLIFISATIIGPDNYDSIISQAEQIEEEMVAPVVEEEIPAAEAITEKEEIPAAEEVLIEEEYVPAAEEPLMDEPEAEEEAPLAAVVENEPTPSTEAIMAELSK